MPNSRSPDPASNTITSLIESQVTLTQGVLLPTVPKSHGGSVARKRSRCSGDLMSSGVSLSRIAEILLRNWDGSCGEGIDPRTPQKWISTMPPSPGWALLYALQGTPLCIQGSGACPFPCRGKSGFSRLPGWKVSIPRTGMSCIEGALPDKWNSRPARKCSQNRVFP